jgi:NTE family protein
MSSPRVRVGIALAGGGALGAYQVGALRCFARLGVTPTAWAGSSIGALNAAVLVAAGDLERGLERLEIVWRTLPRAVSLEVPTTLEEDNRDAASLSRLLDQPILDPKFVRRLVAEHVDLDAVRDGPEVWVAAFPATRRRVLTDLVRAKLLRANAQYFRLQEHLDDAHALITASAALPPVYPGLAVSGRFYRDGGLADNLPARAIADACDLLLVVHLRSGTPWDPRRAGISIPVLEIRPDDPPHDAKGLRGTLAALLDFSPRRLEQLRARGYEDAERALSRAAEMISVNNARVRAENEMIRDTSRLRALRS